MEYTLDEAVIILEYVEDWNVDHETIAMDLMDKFSEYIFTWNIEQEKFIGVKKIFDI